MPTQHRKHRKVFNDPGHAHFLTFSCVHRWPLLTRDRSRMWVIEGIDVARQKHAFDVYAYVIMPEHVHLLVKPRMEEYDISRFLYQLKRSVSFKAKTFLEESGHEKWLERLKVTRGKQRVFRFWQPGGGFDKNICRQEGLLNVARYIEGNPVRRRLVRKTTSWIWSSAMFHAGVGDVPLATDAIPV